MQLSYYAQDNLLIGINYDYYQSPICRLRVGETLALKMKNVDLDGGILILKQAKGDKQRLVPMHQTLTSILNKYCLAIGVIGKAEALLFPSTIQEVPISVKAARNKFNTILKYADISMKGRAKRERGPCLHCLRHVFAFKSFAKAEKSGRSIDASIFKFRRMNDYNNYMILSFT